MKRVKINKLFKEAYKETGRKSLLVFLILRSLIIICMILQLLRGDLNNVLLCILSLALLLLPSIIQHKLNITLPSVLEIIIYFFIFSAEILGEINNFYGIIPFWDTILHTINGFLAAAIGFSTVELLNKTNKKFNLSPIYLCLVAFCFSMTIGVLWEFFEFASDRYLGLDMQKDRVVENINTVYLDESNSNKVISIKNIDKTVLYDSEDNVLTIIDNGYLDLGINDTMKDLFVNFIGAVVFSVFGYFYLKNDNKNKNQFINNFVPRKGSREIPESVRKKLQGE